jgi:phenylalanyl-tRNA synthetase beta chain
MAVVKFKRKELERIIGKVNDEIQEKINLFGTPIEDINESEISLEIFPNRSDLLSMHGFARAFKDFLGKSSGKEYSAKKSKEFQVIVDSSVKDVRPFTACAVIRGIKFDDEKIKEIIDIQEKLHFTIGRKRKKIAIGIYPLEKIKFPITFLALKPEEIKFIPLETDKEMNGLQILQRHPAGKEYKCLLENEKKFPVFRDANNEILSMPPIINSHKTGKITSQTKNIFVECSGFDFELLKKCLNILVTMFSDMGGELFAVEIAEKKTKTLTPDLSPQKTKIDLKNIKKILGIELTEKEIIKLMEKMGHIYKSGNVYSPCYRSDILHERDIIEDIAIAYGYGQFNAEIPNIYSAGEESKEETIKRKITELLVGLGFVETSSYDLISKEDQYKKMNIKINGKGIIEVLNSKTDSTILRENIFASLMKILSENIDTQYPQKIFEIGKTFSLNKEEIEEKDNLCIAMADINYDFTYAKQILEYLVNNLGICTKIEEAENLSFISGRAGKIILLSDKQEKEIGVIGEISPIVLKNLHIKLPVVAFEISLNEIFDILLANKNN